MEKLKIKYAPMIIVIYFSVMGLLIAVILSALDDFFGGSPFLKKLTSSVFISILAILIGLIYCEVRFWIRNIWLGSILFGVLSINLFTLLLPISTLLLKGNIGKLPPLDLYLAITIFIGSSLGALYFGIEKKKT